MKRKAISIARRATFLAAIALVFTAMALAVIVREAITMFGSDGEGG